MRGFAAMVASGLRLAPIWRRVDALTGGPVTLRSAIIQFAATELWGTAARSLLRSSESRNRERLEAIQAELKEAQRAHAGDPEATQRAIMEVYRRERMEPTRSCVPALVTAAPPQLPALWSSLKPDGA